MKQSSCSSNHPQDVRLGLGALSQAKPPVLQYKNNVWHLWLTYNSRLTEGTYILLKPNGTMQRITIMPDGTERIALL